MSKNDYYKQCRYGRIEGDIAMWDVAWLPEKLARAGKQIYFTEDPDTLYTVYSVGDRRRSISDLKKKQEMDRNQRKGSDI